MANDILTLDEQFNNTGVSNTAFAYQPLPSNPLPNQSLFPDWVNNIKSPAISKDVQPEINNILQDMRFNALNLLQNKGKSNVDSVLEQMFPTNNKIQLSSDVPITDTHELASDGKTWIPKYEYYRQGVDNDALNSSMQTSTEKFFNPLKRSATKLIPNIAGGIVSMVNGLGEAIITGRGEAIFDNATSRWLDDLNKKIDFNFKNYYTKEQDNFGFNTNTWDKVLGGVDFTVQMIGSEAVIAALSGGTSIPSSIAKTMGRLGVRSLEVLDKASDVARVADVANDITNVKKTGNFLSKAFSYFNKPIREVAENGGAVLSAERTAEGFDKILQGKKLKEWVNMGRFMYTTSAYEAGFEARHYQQEVENQFWEYYRQNGKEPTLDELNKFYSKLDSTTWGVFGANMAILSVSNMAMFGKAFNIKNPFPKLTDGSFIDKTLFKIGTEKTADGTFKALKPSFFNKALAYSTPFVENALIEGVYEEGSQGIASNMMKNYINSTYDPKAMRETSDYMSSFTKAFKDQFSTKQGLEEVAIGAIVGGLFGGIGGGVQSVGQQYKIQNYTAKVQNSFQGVADQITSNIYTNENLTSLLGHSNRLQKINENAEQAKSSGDKIAEALHSSEIFISTLQAAQSVGKEGEFMKILESTIKGMDSSKIAESQNIDINSVESFKNENIQGLQKLADAYTKAREVAEYIFGEGNIGGLSEIEGKEKTTSSEKAAIKSNLIDAFAYTSAMGHISQELAGDSFNAFQQKLAEIATNPQIVEKFGMIAALRMANKTELTSYQQASSEEKRALSEKKKVENKIIELQKSEQGTQEVNKLKELSDKLIELSAEIEKHRANKELYWRAISDNFYKKLGKSGFLPQIDLDNFENTTKDLKDYLNSASGMSDYDRVELEKLLDSFDKSTETFKSFNNLTKALSNPNFTFKTYKGLFGNLRANKQSLNDLTRKTLLDLYKTDTDVTDTVIQYQAVPKMNDITDEEYKEFIDKGKVSIDRLQDIANKVKNDQELSEKEKAVFDSKKTEIEGIIEVESKIEAIANSSEKTKINPLKARINAIKSEIKKLEKGEVTDSIKEEKDRLEEQLKDVENELLNLSGKTQTSKTATPVSEVEAKRADILRRKQEELSNIVTEINIEENRRPNGSIGTQGFTSENLQALVNFLNNELSLNIPNDLFQGEKIKPLIDYLKSNKELVNKIHDYVKTNPVEINILPDGTIHFQDGNHRANLLNLIGAETIPSIEVENKAQLDEINAKYEAELKELEAREQAILAQEAATPTSEVEDIQRRRQEELRQNLSKTNFAISLFPAFAQNNMSQGGGAYIEINFGKNIIFRVDTYLTPSALNGQYPSITNGTAQLHGEMSDGTKISIPWNQLKDLLNSIKSVNTKGEVVYEFDKDKINAKYDAELTELEKSITHSKEVQDLEAKIAEIEKQIEFLEAQNETSKKVEKNYKESNKKEYKQYSITKPNGEEIIGHLEINKGIVQIVNEKEIVDVVEESDFDVNNLDKHGIRELQEDDILIENNEVYVNGKLYSLPKNTTSLDENISQDENGNYEVKLRAGNNRVVTLKGNVADKIVYEHLLNKFEKNATDEQIRAAREQAERDVKIEKLYEKLDNEAKNRDSQKQRQSELTAKKEELENEIDELIPNKIEELQDEIEDLKSKDSIEKKLEKKKQKLNEKIAKLKNDIFGSIGENKYDNIDSKNPNYNKIRRLRKLERELESLKQVKQEFDPNSSFKNQLQWFVDNASVLDFEDVDSVRRLNPPSDEKIARYSELSNKKRKTKKEKQEFVELRDELLKYKIVENGIFEGVPLIDLISAYNEMVETTNIVDEQKVTIADDELQNSINTAQFEANGSRLTPFVGHMNDGTYVSGNQIHQIKLNTIFENALSENKKIKIEEFKEDESGNVIFADPILVDENNVEELSRKYDNFNGVRITIGDDIFIEKGANDIYFRFEGGLLEMMGLTPYQIMGQSTAYYLLYEQKMDGTFESKQSEFETTRDGVTIPMDIELANSLSEGDEVTLFFDENDDYNKSLDKEEYADKGKIYIMKNGKLVNILKANSKNRSDALWAKLSKIRNNIVKSKSKKATIKLKGSYMGFPIIKLNSDGQIIMNDVVESKVKSYGFINENGNYVFFDDVNDYNSQYTDHFKEYGKKIPIVAFDYNGKNYILPMQLNQKAKDATNDLNLILNDNALNKFQKITEVNKLLKKHNLKTNGFVLDENFENLPKIRQELSNVKEAVDITNLEEIKKVDKSVYVDMNNPFMGSKLILDLDSANNIKDESKKIKKEPLTKTGRDLSDENKC